MFLDIFLASLIIMLVSLSGVLFLWGKLGSFIQKNLSFLVSLSAGVFLIVALQLGQEAISHSERVLEGVVWVFAGAALIYLIFKFVPMFHHHHDGHDGHAHNKIDARRILFGDALHNIGDGVLLAASFTVSVPLGIATAIGIFVHELVQETSEFFVLKQAGYSTRKALFLNFLVSSTILLGALGGFFLLDVFGAIEIPLLGIAAGSFFVVVLHDLIPHSVRNSQIKKTYGKHIAWFLVGVILMVGISFVGAGSHMHGEYDDHGHDAHEEHHDQEHDKDIHSHDESEDHVHEHHEEL
jgi:zinc and cadmium transporter